MAHKLTGRTALGEMFTVSDSTRRFSNKMLLLENADYSELVSKQMENQVEGKSEVTAALKILQISSKIIWWGIYKTQSRWSWSLTNPRHGLQLLHFLCNAIPYQR